MNHTVSSVPVVLLLHYAPEIRSLVRRGLRDRVVLHEANTITEARSRVKAARFSVIAIGNVQPGGAEREEELKALIKEISPPRRAHVVVGCFSTPDVCKRMERAGCDMVVLGHQGLARAILALAFP